MKANFKIFVSSARFIGEIKELRSLVPRYSPFPSARTMKRSSRHHKAAVRMLSINWTGAVTGVSRGTCFSNHLQICCVDTTSSAGHSGANPKTEHVQAYTHPHDNPKYAWTSSGAFLSVRYVVFPAGVSDGVVLDTRHILSNAFPFTATILILSFGNSKHPATRCFSPSVVDIFNLESLYINTPLF